MANNNLDLVSLISEHTKNIESMDMILGKGGLMPFNACTSGSRRLLHSTQTEHIIQLYDAEPPLLCTGVENKFGEYSSSILKADSDLEIIAKIEKFPDCKNHHYYLIVRDINTDTFDVIERISYNYIVESYGYLYNNDFIDSLQPGQIVQQNTIMKKSKSFDEFNNRQDGINIPVAYFANEFTKEDGIIISDVTSKKLASPLIHRPQVMINENNIALNLYGDKDNYKIFPDVGEDIKDGLLMVLRKEKKEESLFSQSRTRLSTLSISDEKIPLEGKVVDIDVYCNNPEYLDNSYYSQQIKFYHNQKMNFLRTFIDVVEPIFTHCKCTYRLQKMFRESEMILNGSQYEKNGKIFSNIVLQFTVIQRSEVKKGDKLTNRFGGKGCVSLIVPEEQMPMREDGKRIGLIYNSNTCFNRENVGQLFETAINSIGEGLIDYIDSGILHFEEALDEYIKYIKMLIPKQAESFERYINSVGIDDQHAYLDTVLSDIGIFISMNAIDEAIDIDALKYIYEHCPYAKDHYVLVPQIDSNGNVRYIKTLRKMVTGPQYIYRLKQYAEEKFSAVSLSATNIKNENTRSNSKKDFRSLHTMTPVQFGEMETGDLAHLGMEKVIVNMMLHSSSPHGRRLCEQLSTGNPFEVDIKLDDTCKNRSVEILNAFLTCMGLELVFQRIPKKRKTIMHRIETYPYLNRNRNIIWKVDKDEILDNYYLSQFTKEKLNAPRKIMYRQPFVRLGKVDEKGKDK